MEFFKKEGIQASPGLGVEDLILGRGYLIGKQQLLSLYDRYVHDDYGNLFPYMLGHAGVTKGANGFALTEVRTNAQSSAQELEWLMPNLANLPVKVAVERMAEHTSHLKVYGSGVVIAQSPRPFERIRGECDCVIQGRGYGE